jgi:hypothetical protein
LVSYEAERRFFVAADCCEPYNLIKEREGVVLQKGGAFFVFPRKELNHEA